MQNHLNQFYNDEAIRESVFEFLLETVDLYALEQIYKGNDVSGIKNAKEIIQKAKKELQNRYEKKVIPNIQVNKPV